MDELLKKLQTVTREELIARCANLIGENETLKSALEDARNTRTWSQTRLDKFMSGEWKAAPTKE